MSRGIRYILEEEDIRNYKKLSVEEKLKWLEEVNAFNNMVFTKKDREIQKKLFS